MRRLNKDVLIQNSWMRYSVSVYAVYCAPCFLFSNDPKEKKFTTTPVSDWKNFGSLILRHTRSGSPHYHCMSLADHFLATELQQKKSIIDQISSKHHETVQKNRGILRKIMRTIALCGSQNIPLRWHTQDDINFMRF